MPYASMPSLLQTAKFPAFLWLHSEYPSQGPPILKDDGLVLAFRNRILKIDSFGMAQD